MSFQIDIHLVQKLIQSQFPQWADLRVKPVEDSGWDNRTFHLGDHMMVRLPSAAGYALQVEKEQYWLPKLALLLPLPIPVPLAQGAPACGYPWPWSIYSWLPGESAKVGHISDQREFAASLAEFLNVFQRANSSGGPKPGLHNFYRGGDLKVYDPQTRQAITALEGKIDISCLNEVWEEALSTQWDKSPVWVHGDISVGNLLVDHGKLSAVIDFGCLGIGDPACDYSIAWTFFSGVSRQTFKDTLAPDEGTWARARGWTLWKALIVAAGLPGTNAKEVEKSRKIIDDVLEEFKLEKSSR